LRNGWLDTAGVRYNPSRKVVRADFHLWLLPVLQKRKHRRYREQTLDRERDVFPGERVPWELAPQLAGGVLEVRPCVRTEAFVNFQHACAFDFRCETLSGGLAPDRNRVVWTMVTGLVPAEVRI